MRDLSQRSCRAPIGETSAPADQAASSPEGLVTIGGMTVEPIIPVFRTPEDVAPELGMTKSELRTYCRESGHCTRLSKNRIMLHEDDIKQLVEWVRARKDKANEWSNEPEPDPFA
jgi:hypothetical protein